MRLNFLFQIICLSCFLGTAQNIPNKNELSIKSRDTVFLDETDKVTTKSTYIAKLETPLFVSVWFENDTLILYKLRFSHLFGKLKDENKNQLFKLLSSRNKVDTTKIMIIHYQDSLKKESLFPKHSGVTYNKDSSKHRHVISYDKFISQHKECIRKLRKRNKNNVYHFYKHNLGHPEKYGKISWYKDHYELIDRLFRDSHRRFKTIVIRQDGNYFCRNYIGQNIDIFDDIIKDKNWEKHNEQFMTTLKKVNTSN